jgi:gliding motility-associated-like protein
MFYMNFGHPGVSWQPNPYNYSSLFLDYIAVETSSGDSSNWTNNQRGVIGISPTADFPENINDLNYSVVSFKAEEKAEVGISVPSSGEQLTVMSNGDLSLVAGNSITIQPGFKVESGGIFTAKIEEQSYFNVDIELISCPTAFTPNGDGINDELTIVADNANSWEFTAFNRWGSVIFQSAGSITGDSANIWDGTDSMPSTTYYCVLRLKNSFGRDLEEEITVLVL